MSETDDTSGRSAKRCGSKLNQNLLMLEFLNEMYPHTKALSVSMTRD